MTGDTLVQLHPVDFLPLLLICCLQESRKARKAQNKKQEAAREPGLGEGNPSNYPWAGLLGDQLTFKQFQSLSVGERGRGLHFSLCLIPHKCSINVSEGVKVLTEKLGGGEIQRGFHHCCFQSQGDPGTCPKRKICLTSSPANLPPTKKISDKEFLLQEIQP